MSISFDVRNKSSEAQIDDDTAPDSSAFSSSVVPYLLSSADAAVILFSSIVGGTGYHLLLGSTVPNILPYCAVGLLASFIYILRMSGGGYYDLPDSAKPRVEIGEILVCWFTTGLLLAFFAFLLKIGVDYSRGSFVIFYFIAPLGLLGARKITKKILIPAVARGAVGRRDVVLLGDDQEVAALQPQDMLALFGATQVVHFTLGRDVNCSDRELRDGRTMVAVSDFVRRNNCREILLALPWEDSCRIEYVRERIKSLPVAARLLPDSRVRALTQFASSARTRVIAIELQRAPLSGAERLVKRTLDVVVSLLAVAFLSPIFLFTAIAVKLDGAGPVIFRQNRKGFNGKVFTMYKFRTMTVQENGPDVVQVTRGDPRVTPIGRLLRSSSIDELPQLWNVLKGDMSVIGPRPHALSHDDYFKELVGEYAFRHHVKPGITGWAQCNGSRGATPSVQDVAERVKLDLWYINNWSLWLDIQILVKTFFAVLRKRNAY